MAKKSQSEGNYRSQKHAVLIYPDDPKCSSYLEEIKFFDHAIILHDKDLGEDGKVKKPHYHVILVTKNQTWRDSVADDLGIGKNYVQRVRNYELALEYLIHANEEKKHHYSLDEVKGTSKVLQQLRKFVEQDELSESDKVAELIEMIMGHEGHLTIREFSWYCAKNNRWDVFRRSGSIFLEIIREKNKGVY